MSLPVKLYPKEANKGDSEVFEQMWSSSKQVRERLIELYSKQLENLCKDDEDVGNMASPNWKERQAFNLGKRKALREIITDLQSKV